MQGIVEGKVAIVTGGGSGIGRAACAAFARGGASVVVADIDAVGGEETARLVREAGGSALFVKCDVSQAADAEAIVGAAVRHFGGLHCAFNNAGVEGQYAKLIDATEENFMLNYRVNMLGVWLCMKFQIRQLLAQGGGGAIVNTASDAGLIGVKYLGQYAAAKHAVIGLTKSAALEYASHRIRVNAVCPGPIRTPMLMRVFEENPKIGAAMVAAQPVKRLGEPHEIADAAVYLCSDHASYITGHALPVDGGYVAT
ncbi:MAG: glucose 1-dehydrogenase [Gammaproteobacteria bacterium]|uniref:glucose 1-dehydrogenase n=1 Tax=Bradyrhizobium sp. TaxID=376 RepID=UPI003D10E2EC